MGEVTAFASNCLRNDSDDCKIQRNSPTVLFLRFDRRFVSLNVPLTNTITVSRANCPLPTRLYCPNCFRESSKLASSISACNLLKCTLGLTQQRSVVQSVAVHKTSVATQKKTRSSFYVVGLHFCKNSNFSRKKSNFLGGKVSFLRQKF